MSMSEKYLDYLDSRIEIAPANSQEEVNAADILQELLSNEGLEVTRQDVTAPNDTRFIGGILLVLAFLGMVVSGIGGIGLAVLGFVVAAVSGGLLVLRYLGIDPFSRILPPARSQNVVGFHKGTGPHAGRGVRPIVVMAHYDTGREELLANPAVSRYSGLVLRWAPLGLAVAALCCLLQLVVVIPEVALRVIWVVGMVCALPGLVCGINDIAAHFAPLTGAANDNNASLAAMLGVAEDVCGGTDEERAQRAELLAQAEAEAVAHGALDSPVVVDEVPAEQRVVTRTVTEMEQVEGVRHGKDVVEALGILPETCQIEYVEPQPVTVEEVVEEPVDPEPEPVAEAQSTRPSIPIPDFLSRKAASQETGTIEVRQTTGRIATEPVVSGPSSVSEPTPRSARRAEEPAPETVTVRETLSVPDFSHMLDNPAGKEDVAPVEDVMQGEPQEPVAPTPSTDGATVAMPVVEQATQPSPAPDVVDDPSWGQTDFTPRGSIGFARRAALFDLPDPTQATFDPLAADSPSPDAMEDAAYEVPGQEPEPPAAEGVSQRVVVSQSTVRSSSSDGRVTVSQSRRVVAVPADQPQEAPAAVPIEPVRVTSHDKARKTSLRDRISHGHGRKKEEQDSMSEWLGVDEDFDAKADGERIGSWDNFSEDDGNRHPWKGGATRSAELRDDEGADPTEDPELAEAVLDMDYVDLVAHDIYFVAVGASELDHAGAKAFVKEYRPRLRGAFLINLDSVGAGQLTLLTEEGAGNVRKVDRRLLKSIDRIARDLHVQLQCSPRPWADTDATCAMRASVRSATLMGCDPGEVPALAHTAENVPQNVSPDQVAQVNLIVSETIRRA
ncbi:M28 family peptidase [Caniella muris]|uniref:M28 family peptidase n=1 Tax=Caniella muris TaxID=2941502 RepID=UPI00203AC3A3|nr:M28 family peptidase [Caniella muris]